MRGHSSRCQTKISDFWCMEAWTSVFFEIKVRGRYERGGLALKIWQIEGIWSSKNLVLTTSPCRQFCRNPLGGDSGSFGARSSPALRVENLVLTLISLCRFWVGHDYYTQSINLTKYHFFGSKLKNGHRRTWGFLRETFEIAGWVSNNLVFL